MACIKTVYNLSFIEKIETLLPEHYTINKYHQSTNNSKQYIMRNSKGYFHIMEIVKTNYGFTFNHYRINKNEMIEDTGEHYEYFKTLEEIKNNIE